MNPAASLKPTSIETLEYYRSLVKGFQDSFPHRTILVLAPVDARQLKDFNATPLDGRPAIGVTTGQLENVIQRLYSDPLGPIIQKAISSAADEAGLKARALSEDKYEPGRDRGVDYVLTAKITRCWVEKHLVSGNRSGPSWRTAADFALELALYKPPFKVPFWEGTSGAEYQDPPIGSFGLGPEDETGIYDLPGQVLSVALTRAAAGVFQHEDLRTLVLEDRIGSH